MKQIQINPKFKELIRPLSFDEQALLEKSIQEEGCRDKIILWNDTIVDGHNRYEICTKLGLPFETDFIQFKDESEAIEWMILNQLGRRNLNDWSLGLLALQLKPIYEARAKANMSEAARVGNISQPSVDTGKELAALAGISDRQLDKIEYIQLNAYPQMKLDLAEGVTWSISRAYNELRERKQLYMDGAVRAANKEKRQAIRDYEDVGMNKKFIGDAAEEIKKIEARYDKVMNSRSGEILNQLADHIGTLPVDDQKECLHIIFSEWCIRMRDKTYLAEKSYQNKN